MFKSLRERFTSYLGMVRNTSADEDLTSVNKFIHRVTIVEDFKKGIRISNIAFNENSSYGATISNRGRKIWIVYPMYDDFKVFFDKYVVFYNYFNSIISVVSISGEKIAEGVWGLSFKKHSLILYKPEVGMEITLNSDGSRSSDTKDLKAVIKKINKHLENIKISYNPHNPEWLANEKKTYFDEIPDEYCTEFYLTSTNPIILNSDEVKGSTLVSEEYRCVELENAIEPEEDTDVKDFKTLDDIINNRVSANSLEE